MERSGSAMREASTGPSSGRDLVGAGLVGLASLQFGIVVALGKVLADTDLPVMWVLAIRFGTAAAILVVVLLVLRRPVMAARGERLPLVLLGVAGYGVEAFLFFLALEHANASTTTLLFFTYPAMVTLASMALGRGAPGLLIGGALVCALAGAGLVIASSEVLAADPLGIVFSLAAGATFSAYLMFADHVLVRTDAMTASAWVSGWASVGLAATALSTGRAVAPAWPGEWVPLGWIGLMTAGAFVCLLAGLRRLGPVRASIVASTEPVSGALLAFVFLGEPITPMMALGGLLILVGAVAAAMARRPERGSEVPFEPPAP